MQISLDLITRERAAAHTLLQQPPVVPGVRGHVMYSTCNKHTIITCGRHIHTYVHLERHTHTHLRRASTVLLSASLVLLAQWDHGFSWCRTFQFRVRIRQSESAMTAPSSAPSAVNHMLPWQWWGPYKLTTNGCCILRFYKSTKRTILGSRFSALCGWKTFMSASVLTAWLCPTITPSSSSQRHNQTSSESPKALWFASQNHPYNVKLLDFFLKSLTYISDLIWFLYIGYLIYFRE